MFEASRERGYGGGYTTALAGQSRVAFLRKVYSLMTAGVVTSAVGAWFAMNFGASSPTMLGPGLAVPPVVGFFAQHYFVGFLMMLGVVFGASMLSRVPVINVVAFFGMTGALGLLISPSIFIAQLRASQGVAFSSQPVLMAFGLAVLEFGGLTLYALLSKRDFSFLGGALTMGFFVVLGAIIVNFFVGGSILSLAISSVIVLLFGGYVLYDTSRILRSGEDNPVPAAITIYMDFINIFLALLRIFSGSRR
jgi:modulator of FtsH protease